MFSSQIREYLPTRDFKSVVEVLAKMLNFMKMTSVGTIGSNKGIKVSQTKVTFKGQACFAFSMKF